MAATAAGVNATSSGVRANAAMASRIIRRCGGLSVPPGRSRRLIRLAVSLSAAANVVANRLSGARPACAVATATIAVANV